jgi:hypothetical protein
MWPPLSSSGLVGGDEVDVDLRLRLRHQKPLLGLLCGAARRVFSTIKAMTLSK